MNAPFTLLLYALALLLGGWWLTSLSGWFAWGLGVMGIGLLILARWLIAFLSQSFQATQQINFLYESRSLSHEYGHARLARETDGFVQELAKTLKGFYIGTLGNLPLFYDPFKKGNGHMLTYAPARTGKTISVIIPALMHWFAGSMFVIDVKAELTAITAAFRRLMGQKVIIFNPFDVLKIKGERFNPLRVLVEDVMHNAGRELTSLARMIAYQLIAERPDDMGDGVFFRNGGRRLIITFLLYMAIFMPDSCNLPTLRKLIWSSNYEKKAIAAKMKECDWFGGMLKDYGNALADVLKSEYTKTYGAFRDNAMAALEIYEAHASLGRATEVSDFSLKDVLDGKTTLYLILPESKLETHGSAMGLITTLLLEEIAALPKPTRIMMLLDEMGNIGKLPNLSKALSLLPGKGVRLWMVFQSRRQPIEIYGQQMAGLIEEQSSMVQSWSIRGELDRKAWSNRTGIETKKARSISRDPNNIHAPWRLNVNERGAPVMSPDAIGRMNMGYQLIAIDGKPVIKAETLAHFQIEPWRSKAEKSPYHEKNYPKDMPVRHILGGRL